MIYAKENPIGIDWKINQIQNKIYDGLLSEWGQVDAFGRVYRKVNEDGFIDVCRINSSGEYESLSFSEGNKIFFLQGDNPQMEGVTTTNDLFLVSVVNLNDISSSSERVDEIAHQNVVSLLGELLIPSNIIELFYGFKSFQKIIESLHGYGNFKFTDIHPYHIFTIKLQVDYSLM